MQIQYLKNIGPARAEIFKRLGILNLEDLFFYFPRRHIDRTTIKKISCAIPGEKETLLGKVIHTEEFRPRKHIYIFKAVIYDGSSYITAVWFNNKYLAKNISEGVELTVTGKVEYRFGKREISVAEFEILDNDKEESVNFGRIVPIYPGLTDKLPQKTFRNIVKYAFENHSQLLKEVLPQQIILKHKLSERKNAIFTLHFPEDEISFEKARRRMAFEELFLLQISLQYGRSVQKQKSGKIHIVDENLRKSFLEMLPFQLTKAQNKVIHEIDKDMSVQAPMARLVQGDVGSGKTVIAQLAILTAVASGSQAALLAPTEILAQQHYNGFKSYLDSIGIPCALLKGGMRQKERAEILNGISTGTIVVVIGTHAIIQNEIIYKNLGLAIIDEQHRFGVRQRVALELKGSHPDVLIMTATPIPRTLSMTLYGDLEVSTIDELPPGRKPIKTYHVKNDMQKRIHAFLEKEVASGRQCYYVCPLVEESEKIDLEAATTLYADLKECYPKLNIGLVHGKLPQKEKDNVMTEFRNGLIDILVATTVIEVGVNVPNASVMVIKDADRFGLAQLHQLRGRIGRGAYQSYCVLLAEPKTIEGKARMEIMEKSNDGFYIAEEDLKLRGPGEFLGTRQHGLSEIKIANLVRDVDLLSEARTDAMQILENDPELGERENETLFESIKAKYFSLA